MGKNKQREITPQEKKVYTEKRVIPIYKYRPIPRFGSKCEKC